MANTIRHKRSSTTGATPAAGSLVTGELAVNTADGKLFTKKDNGTVVEIGGGGGGTPAGSTGQVQFNNAGAFGADNALTFNSTTNVLTVGDATNNFTFNPIDANFYSVLSSRDPLLIGSDTQSIIIGQFSGTATRLNLSQNSFAASVYQLGDFKGSLFIGRSSSDFTAAAALSLNAPTLTLGTTATSVTIGSTTAGSEVDVGNAQLNGTLKDTAGSVGTNGQVLTSTGSGVQWATPSGGGGDSPITILSAFDRGII